MSIVALLNSNDPMFEFEHMMAHREYFAVMRPLYQFNVLPYLLDPSTAQSPADDWNNRHRTAHDDFNSNLPSNFNNGYTITTVTPVPPPTPPHPPYQQATAIDGAGTFGIQAPGILLEGRGSTPEQQSWWTFVNHQQHYEANNAILPLPTTSPMTAGTGPGVADVSNPWWWASRGPVIFPFW